MVIKKRMKKYMTNIGQNTGTSKIEKKVMINAIPVPRKQAYQNLNSGNLLVNGLNSCPSLSVVGRDGPSASDKSSSGVRNAMKLLRRKID